MTNKKGYIKIFHACRFWRFLDKALLLLPTILFIAVVVLSLGIVVFGIYHWEWFNANSGGIQAISTTILVMITAVYAWLVYRSVQELEKQRKRLFYQQIYDNVVKPWIRELRGEVMTEPEDIGPWSYIKNEARNYMESLNLRRLRSAGDISKYKELPICHAFVKLSRFHRTIIELIIDYNKDIKEIYDYIRSLPPDEVQNKDNAIKEIKKEIDKKIDEKKLLEKRERILNYLLEIEEDWLKEGLIELK